MNTSTAAKAPAHHCHHQRCHHQRWHWCHHQRWQKCPGSTLGALFCCTASSCAAKTPCLGAAGTSARLEKKPGVEPAGTPKHLTLMLGSSRELALSRKDGVVAGGAAPVAVAWDAVCISFLSPLAGCVPSCQPCGDLCGTHCRGWHQPLPRLLARSWQCQGGKHCVGRCPLLHPSLREGGAGTGCKASSRQGINCSCVELL